MLFKVTGLYLTNSLDINAYILKDAKSNIAVIDNIDTMNDILEIKNELPHLKVIINLSDTPVDHPHVITWKTLMDMGYPDNTDTTLQKRHMQMAVNECAWITYTSGTTGMPKGVLLFKIIFSHPHWFQEL